MSRPVQIGLLIFGVTALLLILFPPYALAGNGVAHAPIWSPPPESIYDRIGARRATIDTMRLVLEIMGVGLTCAIGVGVSRLLPSLRAL